MVIMAAAATAATHHVLLWLYLPQSILNYDAPFWIILVHTLFVVVESTICCVIAKTFFDSVIGMEKNVNERTQEIAQTAIATRGILANVNENTNSVSQDADQLASTASSAKSAVANFEESIQQISSSVGDATSQSRATVEAMMNVNTHLGHLNDHNSEIESMISVVTSIAE